MAPLQILIAGATGYIGGADLTTLLNSSQETLGGAELAALVRREDQAEILKSKGVRPILFHSLDETDLLTKMAEEYDVLINQTSGTSNLGDRPITGKYHEIRTFSDKDDVYGYEQEREAIEAYSQRTTDLVVVQTGIRTGVKTYIIMSPMIYGISSGFFNTQSIQIPTMIRSAIATGNAQMIESGSAIWDHVHIDDLAPLYELILTKAVAGEDLPYGPKGIYFSEAGQHTWAEMSQGIASAGYALGKLQTSEVKKISLQEAAQVWSGGDARTCELGFASNSRSKSELGSELGWKPTKTEEDWQNNFREEFTIILAKGA